MRSVTAKSRTADREARATNVSTNPARARKRIPASARRVTLTRRRTLWAGTFTAMGGLCEVLVAGASRREAEALCALAAQEAWRVERAFSRYRDDNVVHRINTARGRALDVDAETARLLDFADRCHRLSDGLFDITSGVLRRAWRFDGSDRVPSETEIAPLLALVGWQQVNWRRPRLTLPTGMQIDFGGIGKEYAVDRALSLIRERSERPVLVNFGGDLHASAPPGEEEAWQVGIETARCRDERYRDRGEHGSRSAAARWPRAATPARHVTRDGVRYGHVLNPFTGWPVTDAPALGDGSPPTAACRPACCRRSRCCAARARRRMLAEQGLPYRCQR